MGMYTELCFNAELKKNTPQYVVDILLFLVNPDPHNVPAIPPHDSKLVEFTTDSRWMWLFSMDSAYFPHNTTRSVFTEYGRWYVNVHSNLKNYNDEIENFLEWIAPWVEGGAGSGNDFLGYYLYESDDEPTLIYQSKLLKEKT